MTAMSNAIKQAGIAIPLNKRIWLWLKDHPNKSGSDIAKAISAEEAHVATQCKTMYERGMLVRHEEMRRVRGGVPGGGHFTTERAVNVYAVDPKMRGEYALLPKPKAAPSVPITVAAPPAAPLWSTQAAAKDWTPEAAVEGLSLTQCRELFNFLHKIFKE